MFRGCDSKVVKVHQSTDVYTEIDDVCKTLSLSKTLEHAFSIGNMYIIKLMIKQDKTLANRGLALACGVKWYTLMKYTIQNGANEVSTMHAGEDISTLSSFWSGRAHVIGTEVYSVHAREVNLMLSSG